MSKIKIENKVAIERELSNLRHNHTLFCDSIGDNIKECTKTDCPFYDDCLCFLTFINSVTEKMESKGFFEE